MSIEFITNVYTKCGLKLPMIHLDLLKEKIINCNNSEYKIIDNTEHAYNTKKLKI